MVIWDAFVSEMCLGKSQICKDMIYFDWVSTVEIYDNFL